jgi:hypothetical protein
MVWDFLVESMLVSLIVCLPENNGMYIVFCACIVLMVCANPSTGVAVTFAVLFWAKFIGGGVMYMLRSCLMVERAENKTMMRGVQIRPLRDWYVFS